MNIVMERADPLAADFVARNLRPFDQTEIAVFRDRDAYFVVMQAFETSQDCWVMKVDGEPVALVGYWLRSILTGDAVPFFFATEWPEKHPALFAKYSKPAVDAMPKHYSMCNFTMANNTKILRWLKWLGFTLGDEFTYNGVKVILFSKAGA